VVHARHVYVSTDLVFGARLVDILRQEPDGSAVIDYTRFHDVEPIGVPVPLAQAAGDGTSRNP
jgi:inward rectifier potassium channel